MSPLLTVRPAFAGHRNELWILLGSLALWSLFEVRQRLNTRRDATNMDGGSRLVLGVSGIVAAAVAATGLTVRAADYPESSLVFAIALLAVWTGIVLRIWCFATLGRLFTFNVMASADQEVVSSGPYRVLRHPSYAALLLILAGIGAMYGNWLSLTALVVLPLVGFVKRIRVEEAALASTLGSRYTAYAASRKRLIPFVW